MYKKYFKRPLDILFAVIVLGVLLPLFIPIMIILLLTGEHEVFYLQNRVGYKNNLFKIWKFATMLKNSPNMGSLTLRDDPRVLPVGKFLRKTKINELPQFINVLIGNMSVVGPRPQVYVDYKKFPLSIQEVIYNVKPGITGIGSIVFRDEEKLVSQTDGDPHEYYETHIAPYKGALEVWYQEHLTFWTDIVLVFLTVWVIVSPKSQLVNKIFKDLPPRPKSLIF